MSERRPRVLFLCTGNSCRSQMAEAWARSLHGGCIEALSAGTAPHGVDPRAVRVMGEAGVDMSGQASKSVDDMDLDGLDLVITVCGHAHENCPVFPASAPVMHRGFDDPPALARATSDEEAALTHYRRVRDEIRDFARELPQLLRTEPESPAAPARPADESREA